MSLIQILDCMFGYEGSAENVFDNLSLSLDTSWKLGLVGRNVPRYEQKTLSIT